MKVHKIVSAAILGFTALLCAQDPPAAQPPDPAVSKFPQPEKKSWFPAGPLGLKWVTIGFRVPTALQPEIASRSNTSTVSTTTTTTFATAGQSARVSLALVLEFPIYKHLTFVAEGVYHHVQYQQIRDDTVAVSGGNNVTNVTQSTRALQLDFPLMLRYTGLRSDGALSKLYVAGGTAYRKLTSIKTTTDSVFTAVGAESVTTNSTVAITPARKSTQGVVAAVGFRLLDSFNIRVTPEFRFTRWQASVFDQDTTRSRRNQMEVGIGLTF